MKHFVTLIIGKYVNVGDDYKMVEVSRTFTFNTWDDAQNFIGYLVEGADGWVKFEVRAITEE